MKTENTLDKKAKFFSQYWGLDVVYYYGKLINVHIALDEKPIENLYLQLKPLKSISDEDATYLGFPDNISATTTYLKSLGKELKEADYLRSKGYALSWMDLTVQDLIDYGWIKLVK